MNKRLWIILMLVLVLGLSIFGAMALRVDAGRAEPAGISPAETAPAEPAPADSAGAEALSLEDYYPPLRESYGGYPVPTPDGSLRLSSLCRNPDTPGMLVVRTDFTYNADGTLGGTRRYFDAEASCQYLKLFFGWDPEVCLVEADDQGRASRVTLNPGQENEYVTEFSYPAPGAEQQAFHVKTVYSDGSVQERDVLIEDYDPRDEIQKTQSELSPDSQFEYDEDGLVLRATMAGRTDLEGEPMTENYFYQYLADNNGFLEYVFGPGRISFNKHGYLTEYPLVPAGACNYEYRYVPTS